MSDHDSDQFNRGGIIRPSSEPAVIAPDEHVLFLVDQQWRCGRPDHQRHVCHGNQYDPDTMAWRSR